jgi:hypothetical protein
MSSKSDLAQAVENLSDKEAEKVLGFIDALKKERAEPRLGSAEAVLRAAGSWWMTSEETRRFLIEIDEMRHAEDPHRAIPVRL